MANDSGPQQRQSALAFWKSYFATPPPFPDRRRACLQRKSLVR